MILDRYVLTKFLLPFVYSFVGFLAIWFIFDLSSNLTDFLEGHVGVPFFITYYSSQLPEIIVMCLPICALLALLYSLTAMSRSNEIISMLTAGRSVMRVLRPLLATGLALVGITAYFNNAQAPHAEAIKKELLKELREHAKKENGLTDLVFRNRQDMRTWFMRRIYAANNKLFDIQIVQQNANGDITKEWYGRNMYYEPAQKMWLIWDGKYVEMNADGDITKSVVPGAGHPIVITGWSETPYRVASSTLNADYMSISELREYLNLNSDFPQNRLAPFRTQLYYRYALPWVCLLAVFLAAPMGIVYSRRGILGGVALAIFMFFSLVFISSLTLALGKGDRISPFMATWGPLLFFFAIGTYLLWMRSTNRDLPKLKIPGF